MCLAKPNWELVAQKMSLNGSIGGIRSYVVFKRRWGLIIQEEQDFIFDSGFNR